MQVQEINTIGELYDLLTRKAISKEIDVSKQTLSNWKADGQIPATRFDAFDKMCRRVGFTAPRHLFAFNPAADAAA